MRLYTRAPPCLPYPICFRSNTCYSVRIVFEGGGTKITARNEKACNRTSTTSRHLT